jgi:hypothetical protein
MVNFRRSFSTSLSLTAHTSLVFSISPCLNTAHGIKPSLRALFADNRPDFSRSVAISCKLILVFDDDDDDDSAAEFRLSSASASPPSLNCSSCSRRRGEEEKNRKLLLNISAFFSPIDATDDEVPVQLLRSRERTLFRPNSSAVAIFPFLSLFCLCGFFVFFRDDSTPKTVRRDSRQARRNHPPKETQTLFSFLLSLSPFFFSLYQATNYYYYYYYELYGTTATRRRRTRRKEASAIRTTNALRFKERTGEFTVLVVVEQ